MEKRFWLLLACAFVAPVVWAIKVDISYNHEAGTYAVGEKAQFSVTVREDGGPALTSGVVKVKLDNFGPQTVLPEREVDLAKANPFLVEGSLAEPGFLRITVSSTLPKFPDHGHYVESVAYEPERLRPPTACPADFEAFWRQAIARYDAEIKAEPLIRLDDKLSDAQWLVYRVELEVPASRRLYAFLTKPRSAAGKLPVRVQFASAGYGHWSQKPVYVPGHLSLFITVYPFEPDVRLGKKREAEAVSAATQAKWGVGYPCAGISVSREDYFFYPVILGGNRLVNWLVRREDADPERVYYAGGSQGGGLGLALVALNDKFKKAAICVPALSGFFGYQAGYESGWPKLVESHPEAAKAAVLANAPYFDGVNFATLIKIPVRMCVGYSDTTCPPPDVWTAFNMLASDDKAMLPYLRTNHFLNNRIYNGVHSWLK